MSSRRFFTAIWVSLPERSNMTPASEMSAKIASATSNSIRVNPASECRTAVTVQLALQSSTAPCVVQHCRFQLHRCRRLRAGCHRWNALWPSTANFDRRLMRRRAFLRALAALGWTIFQRPRSAQLAMPCCYRPNWMSSAPNTPATAPWLRPRG